MTDQSVFEQMLNLGDDNALLRYTLGSAFLKKEQYKQAIEQLSKAVEYAPKYVAAWSALGHALAGDKSLQESIEAYTEALKIAKEKNDKDLAKEMEQAIAQVQQVAKLL